MPDCDDGEMRCLVSGLDVLEHARSGTCPLDRFNGPASGHTDSRTSPMPFDQWPAWAVLVYAHRRHGESGVGDTVERLLGRAGKLAEKLAGQLGLPCRCPERKENWNKIYPYEDVK